MKKTFFLSLFLGFISFLLFSQTENSNVTDAQGRKQGYWKKYQDKMLLYEGEFKNDVPMGIFKYYYP
ncbi:MAG: hypothetical protein LBU51_10635, partial [Bacteroidales bacterium]|nr:hypothetical protein [Bacteroidales bacterium]